jgi:hypothetical protein
MENLSVGTERIRRTTLAGYDNSNDGRTLVFPVRENDGAHMQGDESLGIGVQRLPTG